VSAQLMIFCGSRQLWAYLSRLAEHVIRSEMTYINYDTEPIEM